MPALPHHPFGPAFGFPFVFLIDARGMRLAFGFPFVFSFGFSIVFTHSEADRSPRSGGLELDCT